MTKRRRAFMLESKGVVATIVVAHLVVVQVNRGMAANICTAVPTLAPLVHSEAHQVL